MTTDKASSHHRYTTHYQTQLARFCGKPATLIELGVARGASLRMWKAWQPVWRVVGIDKNPRSPAEYHGDGTHADLAKQIVATDGRPNILVDDGSHRHDDAIRAWNTWWEYILPGGVYVIEDLHCAYSASYTPAGSVSALSFLCSRVMDDLMEQGRGGCGRPTQTTIGSIQFYKSLCFIQKRDALAEASATAKLQEPPARLMCNAAATALSRLNGALGCARFGSVRLA